MIKLTIGAHPYKVLSVQKYRWFNEFSLIESACKGLALPKVKSGVMNIGFLSQIANRCLLLTCDSGFEITFRAKNRSARQVKRNKIDVICFTQPAMAGSLYKSQIFQQFCGRPSSSRD